MNVELALREIDEAVQKHVGTRDYESTREGYERTLSTVSDAGGDGVVADLTRWIGEQVRREESLPAQESVDERARELLTNAGHEVPEDSHLTAA